MNSKIGNFERIIRNMIIKVLLKKVFEYHNMIFIDHYMIDIDQ